MSEILDAISKSKNIVEWIEPWSDRLARATGMPAPQSGGAGRMSWEVESQHWPQLAAAVKRLIVPELIADQITAEMNGDEDCNRLILASPTIEAWFECFPANDLTNIITVRGLKRWAAIAITDNKLAMGIFARENDTSGVEAMIQPISEDVTTQLVLHAISS